VFAGTSGFTPCAITVGGALYCWGYNSSGQVGNGVVGTNQPLPFPISGMGSGVTQAGTGNYHSCAIQAGALYCWGLTKMLGNGFAVGNTPTPVAVASLAFGVTAVSVGYDMTCAIQAGALYCWGFNTNGELGDGSGNSQYVPVPIIASGVTAVAAGYYATCAIVNGGARCWGHNNKGQVGLDTGGADVVVPYALPASVLGGPVNQISVGNNHVCALSNGTVKCWGDNGSGQLGNGSTTNTSLPVVVGPWL
jgi:alpha-tubulin suppressor-like RCC1 family protein